MTTISPSKSKAWHEARRSSIGGSDANIIMSGDAEKILRLWQEKVGRAEPEDLSGEFRVQLGTFTEAFNADWFGFKTKMPVTARGDRLVHPEREWMTCTLDGMVQTQDGATAVWEAKHIGAHNTMASALAKYQPQLHHNMLVLGVKKAFLSVIIGNEWDYAEVDFDQGYADALLQAEADFWECVELKLPPSAEPVTVAPPAATREVDMTGNNEWADVAAEWLAHKDSAKRFDVAAGKIKELVAADVRLATGHGIKVARDKRRYLKISEA